MIVPSQALRFVAAAVVVIWAVLSLVGCTGSSARLPENQELRLTGSTGYSLFPSYSPDGQWIAFSHRPRVAEGEPTPAIGVWVVRTTGDQMEPVYTDSLHAFVLGWREDGKALFLMTSPDMTLREVALNGTVLRQEAVAGLSRPFAVSRDGKQVLGVKFNGDNNDLVVYPFAPDPQPRLLTESPEWEVDATFGPGPREITFVRQSSYSASASEIGIWRPDAPPEMLALPTARHSEPEWSPDGRYLAFASDQSGSDDIWIHDARESRNVRLTHHPDSETGPVWSPDGQWITYTSHSRTSNILVVDGESRESRRLTQGAGTDLWPNLSPDGQWVAFIRQHGGEDSHAQEPHLMVASTATGETTSLDLGGLRISAREIVMNWSPDSQGIAFSAEDASGNLDIYCVDRLQASTRRVTIRAGMDLAPSWSPDGKRISFTRVAGGETQIWVIPATGGLAQQVSFGKQVSQMAVWADDSRHLAYQVIRDDKRQEIRVVDVDGDESPRVVASSQDRFLWPVGWSADGEEVLVWRVKDDVSRLFAVRMDGTREVELGEIEDDKYLFSFPVRFNPTGERYRNRIYRGGFYVTTDGEANAEIISIPVGEFLESPLQARLIGGLP